MKTMGNFQKVLFVIAFVLILSLLTGVAAVALAPEAIQAIYQQLFRQPFRNPPNRTLQEEQAITHGRTTLRLINVVATGSHTVVELAIEDSAITGAKRASQRLYIPIHEEDLQLVGFTDKSIRSYVIRPAPGRELHVIELGPLASFEAPATIEITTLLKRWPDGRHEPLPGPWRFQFDPRVPTSQQFRRRIQVGQIASMGEVRIGLMEIELSADQTLVFYEVVVTPGKEVSPVMMPEIHWDDEMVAASGGAPGADGRWVASFPALPEGVDAFTLVFPPFLVGGVDGATFTLDLPDLSGLTGQVVSLDKPVQVGGASFLCVSLEPNPASFSLTCEPVNERAGRLVLVELPGEAVDDLGNHYRITSGGFGWPSAGATSVAVGRQEIIFAGPLAEDARQLTISIERVAHLMSAPVEFRVEVPQE